MRIVWGLAMRSRQLVNVSLLIFLCFLWTGTAYISWLYHLTELVGGPTADWMSEGVGYLFQAAGLFLLALFVRRGLALVRKRWFLSAVVLIDALAIAGALFSTSTVGVVACGFIMNLMHGVVAGVYLTRLALYVPQQKKGTVFGIAYGAGSIGSWLLSLPMGGDFLQSSYSFIVYLVLIGLTLLLNHTGAESSVSDDVGNSPDFRRPDLFLIAAVVVLLSVVKGLGFYFPLTDSLNGTVNLEFSRAFYAVGLIAAGLIGDKNRKYGAICCLAALVFFFVSLALGGVAGAASVLWILAYVFFGFFAVWRVVVFCDIAAKKDDLIWMAGLGLMFGRVGDAASVAGGILLRGHSILLVLVSAALFVVTVMAFFALYHKLYVPVITQEQYEEKILADFEQRYKMSARESEVFRLMEAGRSNKEIAGDLYISESTVKFHVKNVLKKTSCSNRTELAMKVSKS